MPTINYIWLGNNRLGPLELFNIYSWKLVGFDVGIYTLHFTPHAAHNSASLGLDPDDGVAVHDLHALLGADNNVVTVGDPRTLSNHMRTVLLAWYNYAWTSGLDGDPDTKRDQIFNMVDLTKSYIGATRYGLVLDMKVGPSPHLQAYLPQFALKFISYKRGNLVVGDLPENQCVGTLQVADTIRCTYATYFNGLVNNGLAYFRDHPKTKHYDQFTLFHGRFFGKPQNRQTTLNVTVKAPDGSPIGTRYKVKEIGEEESHGPFRVFKRSTDQTNQSSGAKTTPAEVKALAWSVWLTEMPHYHIPGGRSGYYRGKVEDALYALPS